MKRFVILFMILAGTVLAVHAQQKKPRIVFKQRVHNFGTIKEDGGKVTHSFSFTNQGGQPLVINKVDASCGCTTPSWTRKPVEPGQSGFVRVTFDPRRRPGHFNKSIVVRSSAINGTVLLRIQGRVTPRQRSREERYPRKMGALRLKSHHLSFARVLHTRTKHDSLGIVNVSDQPVRVSFDRVPDHITLFTHPEVIGPGKKAYLHGRYDPTRIEDWGFRMDRVRLKVDGENVPHNYLVVSAKIMEDFSDLSPRERKNAPHVKFEATSHDFGRVEKAGRVSYVFRFKNTGNRPLKIRKIRATCGCTTVRPEKKVIPSGESSSFKAILNVGNRQGQLHKSIYFISNDPENSNLRLTLKARVK